LLPVFTLKNLLMIIYAFKKHENFLKTMKNIEFFFITYMGKWSELELEPEPEFLTSWSRSRTAQKWTGSATLPAQGFEAVFRRVG
jgi:hypothetical protein